jgi:putative DNA primase/helicase
MPRDRVWDADSELRTAAEMEGQRYRAAQIEIADARPPEYSDEALALRFSEKHGESIQYVAVWNRWLHWNGRQWQFDATLRTFDQARAICRVSSSGLGPTRKKLAARIASARTVAAIVTLARADRRHAATAEQWDVDPLEFNTP